MGVSKIASDFMDSAMNMHGGGGGGDDGANPHLNLRLEYKTTFFKENMPIDSRPSMCVIMVIV